jgi:hypothetical protein
MEGIFMKQIGLRKLAIATSTVAVATLLSAGWSERGGLSLSVDTAQARRLYVSPHRYYPSPFSPAITGLPWDAVRAYYNGGPWCGVVGGSYSTAVGVFGRDSYTCYSGWDNYAQLNGIGCRPGTLVKGGDGIMYACQ